jgi:hypothetical protein
MCTLTVLQTQWLMSIEQDRYVCKLTVLQSHLLKYMEQESYVYHNCATDTLVNIYRIGPVCVN